MSDLDRVGMHTDRVRVAVLASLTDQFIDASRRRPRRYRRDDAPMGVAMGGMHPVAIVGRSHVAQAEATRPCRGEGKSLRTAYQRTAFSCRECPSSHALRSDGTLRAIRMPGR